MRTLKADYILLGTTLLLIIIGLLVLASASSFLAEQLFGRPYHFLIQQIFQGVILGGILGFLLFKISLEKLKKKSLILLFINIILLILVFLPNLGWQAGGATRWLRVGDITFQPSELLKVILPLYLAVLLTKNSEEKTETKIRKKFLKRKIVKPNLRIARSYQKLISFSIVLAVIFFLLILQPDFSTLVVILAIAILMYFTANTPIWHSFLVVFLIAGTLFALITISPYKSERLMVFLNPSFDPMGAGYQTKQALIAIGSGGTWGIGMGLSQQRLGFLPEPLGDTIFAIFAEETGFLGSFILICLFSIFLWRGLKIAKNAPNPFLKLLALGITCQIVLQAFINIGALIGVLPMAGIPLPFISYGGSHFVAGLMGVGILLNISRQRY